MMEVSMTRKSKSRESGHGMRGNSLRQPLSGVRAPVQYMLPCRKSFIQKSE